MSELQNHFQRFVRSHPADEIVSFLNDYEYYKESALINNVIDEEPESNTHVLTNLREVSASIGKTQRIAKEKEINALRAKLKESKAFA